MAPPPECWTFKPVEHEQGAFDASDFLEGKIELLSLKSAMDGVAAVFFAATSRSAGLGVVVTAFVVLVFQSLLTFAAKALRPIAKDEGLLADLSGAGGLMLVGIGLGLLEVKRLAMADYLPALILAPLFVLLGRRLGRKTSQSAG